MMVYVILSAIYLDLDWNPKHLKQLILYPINMKCSCDISTYLIISHAWHCYFQLWVQNTIFSDVLNKKIPSTFIYIPNSSAFSNDI